MTCGRISDRRKQAFLFLAGHALLALGFVFFTVGFATDHWLDTEYHGRFGLWSRCADTVCSASTSGFSSWMIATRALETMSLMCYMAAILMALAFNCVSMTLPDCTCRGGPAVLEVLFTIGNVLCLITVIVYGSKGEDHGSLGYSYGLTVLSLCLSTPGGVMVAFTRRHVANHNGSVAPTAVTTISGSQQPPGGRGGGGGGVGSGHPPPRRGNSSGSVRGYGGRGSGGGADTESGPYGGEPRPPSSRQQLPYPLHPSGLENQGTFSGHHIGFENQGSQAENLGAYMTYPARSGGPQGSFPGPEARRGGHGPHGSGRLPPLSGPPPSAPFPPDDGEAPPTYLEAVGGQLGR